MNNVVDAYSADADQPSYQNRGEKKANLVCPKMLKSKKSHQDNTGDNDSIIWHIRVIQMLPF